MSRDPRTYNNPHEFDPTRFLGEHPEQDPRAFVYGWGRRICPGRLYADNSVFLVVIMALATLNISAAEDIDGNKIVPAIEFEGGSIM
jgi:cytochrome P450